MSTSASPAELAFIFGLLGIPLGLIPLAASVLALRRPTRSNRRTAAIVAGAGAALGLLLPYSGPVFTLAGAVLACAALLWAVALRRDANGWGVIATGLCALPSAYVAVIAFAWLI